MYWDEGAHARPHFRARYGEYQASVDFHGDVVVAGFHHAALGFGPRARLWLDAADINANDEQIRDARSVQ